MIFRPVAAYDDAVCASMPPESAREAQRGRARFFRRR
jgi:hypothetical protein